MARELTRLDRCRQFALYDFVEAMTWHRKKDKSREGGDENSVRFRKTMADGERKKNEVGSTHSIVTV